MAVVIAARSGYSPYGLVGVLQTLSAVPKPKSTDILNMNSTHPDPVARMQQLDKLMGTKLDAYAGAEDVPGFAAIRGRPSGR
jgi:predicted Zn-dependent protease